MIASVAMSWRCAEWFMNLEDPTTQQSAFVSVIMGVMTGGRFRVWQSKSTLDRFQRDNPESKQINEDDRYNREALIDQVNFT